MLYRINLDVKIQMRVINKCHIIITYTQLYKEYKVSQVCLHSFLYIEISLAISNLKVGNTEYAMIQSFNVELHQKTITAAH